MKMSFGERIVATISLSTALIGCGGQNDEESFETARHLALSRAAAPLLSGMQTLESRGWDNDLVFEHLGVDPGDKEKFRQSWPEIRENLLQGIQAIDLELSRATWKDRP